MKTSTVMKQLLIFAVTVILSLAAISSLNTLQAQTTNKKDRPKVAVVLSGGGAKGSAHVGALKVIEEMGIPVDMVVGTSMGSLVSGIYSIGYSANEIDSIIKLQNWSQIIYDKNDPSKRSIVERQDDNRYFFNLSFQNLRKMQRSRQGIILGNYLNNLFTEITMGYHDSISFDSLPIPFACVAVNIIDDSQVNLRSGHLATAMRASMSIPGVFSPVTIGDMVLVDGGLKDNFPVDLAKEMGADIIIGVSVRERPAWTANTINTTFDVLSGIFSSVTLNNFDKHVNECDVYIHIDVSGYEALSFNEAAIDTLIRRGYEASAAHRDELSQIVERVGGPITMEERPHHKPFSMDKPLRINKITTTNVSDIEKKLINWRFKGFSDDTLELSFNQIEDILYAMRYGLYYNKAEFQLHQNPDSSYNLLISTQGRQAAKLYFGAHYDNITNVSAELYGVIPFRKLMMNLEPTIHIGTRFDGKLALTWLLKPYGKLTLSYMYQHNMFDVYEYGNYFYHFIYALNQVDFGIKDFGTRNFNVSAFARWDYVPNFTQAYHITYNYNHISYHAKIKFCNLDEPFLGTKGIDIGAEMGAYTDNGYQMEGNAPLHILSAHLKATIPIGKSNHFFIEPALYGRFINDFAHHDESEEYHLPPLYLINYIGSPLAGLVMEQQLPYIGTIRPEIAGPGISTGILTLRYKWREKHNVMLSSSVSFGNYNNLVHYYINNTLRAMFQNTPDYGFAASYFNKTIIGPMGVTVGYNTLTNKPTIFISLGYQL